VTARIEGVSVRPLRRIEDPRGAVLHMLRADDPWFEHFGEIYFSAVHAGEVRAWRRHTRLTSNLAVPTGSIRLALVDGRPGSPTAGQRLEIDTGDGAYALVTIPPGVWTGWQGLGPATALVANCATEPHDPDEVERADADSLERAPGEV
jgi:dTDP-4-dehydrorhamnose 3,5-epimerase